jgi:Xaa-Pro aminopeptidase
MRYPKIEPDLFTNNRQKLISRLENGSIAVIHSNDQMVRSRDQYYPYRQNSDLFYLSGIEQELSVLLLCNGQEDENNRVILFLRKPEPLLETWEGRKLDMKTAEEISGIKNIHWLEEFESVARRIILNVKSIYCNIQEHEKFKPEYPQRDQRMMEALKTAYPAHEFKRLAPVMAELRCVKEPVELELIRKAVEITGGGLERVLSFIQPGVLEYQVEAELSHEFISQGAGGHAYAPIIASGENACMLHYIKNDRTCSDGELLLMDVGAEYANYAADCTRTVPVNGKYSKRQKELYNACLRVFRNTSRLIQPGTCIDDINKDVGKLWEEEHIKLGLYTAEELKKQDRKNPLYKKYYPHGTCHFVGLDVHDAGSNQTVLRPGMVLTCEPGIYIPEEKTGIRLENMILVTESGNEDMMRDFPIETGEIEELMNKNH